MLLLAIHFIQYVKSNDIYMPYIHTNRDTHWGKDEQEVILIFNVTGGVDAFRTVSYTDCTQSRYNKESSDQRLS